MSKVKDLITADLRVLWRWREDEDHYSTLCFLKDLIAHQELTLKEIERLEEKIRVYQLKMIYYLD